MKKTDRAAEIAEHRPWRQGRKVPHHIYEQVGENPSDKPWPEGDRPIATFLDPSDAEKAVHIHNHPSRTQPNWSPAPHREIVMLRKIAEHIASTHQVEPVEIELHESGKCQLSAVDEYGSPEVLTFDETALYLRAMNHGLKLANPGTKI